MTKIWSLTRRRGRGRGRLGDDRRPAGEVAVLIVARQGGGSPVIARPGGRGLRAGGSVVGGVGADAVDDGAVAAVGQPAGEDSIFQRTIVGQRVARDGGEIGRDQRAERRRPGALVIGAIERGGEGDGGEAAL